MLSLHLRSLISLELLFPFISSMKYVVNLPWLNIFHFLNNVNFLKNIYTGIPRFPRFLISTVYNSILFSSSLVLKSVHFKKTVARISILSKLWYFLLWFLLKIPQFWKNRDLRNCLLKMSRLYRNNPKNTNANESEFHQ